MSPSLDLTRARIEIRKLERMEAHAWPQLTVAVRTMFDSLPGVKRRPRRLQPEASNKIVDDFLARTAGNPLLLGRDTQPLTRRTSRMRK
jgi:hypothetical protein